MRLSLYLKLMRFDKPVGILLLWLPTAWALWIANSGRPSLLMGVYFFLGSVIMRAAGCVMNDIADRNFDRHVKRTATRPLTTGAVSLLEALILLAILLFSALIILFQLPGACFKYAVVAIWITVLYPFCKRFFRGPQFVLGLAFSMGIPMAFAASEVPFNTAFSLLFLINFLWIVSYDTIYAMVDRDDDLILGLKSTAILFYPYDRQIILGLQIGFHSLWLVLSIYLRATYWFYFAWLVAGAFLVQQQKLVNTREREACFKAFKMNVWYGMAMWMALM